MPGIKYKSHETTKDFACVRATTYVEQATNTIIRNLSHGRLQEVEEQNKCLLRIQEEARIQGQTCSGADKKSSP
jgi:hypothetical protein